MLANVWEWCCDGKWTYSQEIVIDPQERADEGANRVIRGGNWDSHAQDVRAAYR